MRGLPAPPASRRLAAAVIAVLLPGCGRVEPPAPDGSPSVALPEGPARVDASLAVTMGTAGGSPPGASAGPTAVASPAPSASSGAPADPVADPSVLPQTHDRPAPSSHALDARIAALFRAIVADDPAQATSAFFPLGAYRQVKDIPDPASDWKRRLVAAFDHDIHALHARLGAAAAEARLVGLELPDSRARWVDPGEEYNKIGYYRVFGSRVRYEVGGAPRSFEIKSFISWRGEWYVVHLSAIQ